MWQLYDYFRSTASYRVRVALRLKNIDVTKHEIHLIHDGGQQHSDHYKAINPWQLVPSLQINDQHILTQSIAILEYLEETVPEPAILPDDPFWRAKIRSISLAIACDIHPLNNLGVLQFLEKQFNINHQQKLQWYHQWLKRGFDGLEISLAQYPRKKPVCYGNDISMADICLIPQVYNAHRFEFALDNYPLISSIYDYCMQLECFAEESP